MRSPFSPPSQAPIVSQTTPRFPTTSILSHMPRTPASRSAHTRRPSPLPEHPRSGTGLSSPRASYRPEDSWRSSVVGMSFSRAMDENRLARCRSRLSVESPQRLSCFLVFTQVKFGLATHKKHDLVGAITLSSHRSLPSFVPNSGVFVQAYAVGLENFDRQIVTATSLRATQEEKVQVILCVVKTQAWIGSVKRHPG
jgi:hypothetical protein